MKYDDLTIKEAREIVAMSTDKKDGDYSELVGENVFIRTVTHHYTGRLIEERAGVIILANAAWIAGDGRFSNAMNKGELDEVEPYHPDQLVRISKGAILDLSIWLFELPDRVK